MRGRAEAAIAIAASSFVRRDVKSRPFRYHLCATLIESDPEVLWQLHPLAEFHWRTWDDASVLLEARSGQIHACEPLAAAVMACLEEDAASIEDIARMLAADLQVPSDAEFESAIGEIVHQFQVDGWVEPIMHR